MRTDDNHQHNDKIKNTFACMPLSKKKCKFIYKKNKKNIFLE